jgi:hypothetical protein
MQKNLGKKMTDTIEGEKNKNYQYHRRGEKSMEKIEEKLTLP